jgi:hypothetical protein
MKHFPRQLSGGQEQRVAIARAIVADPTFLLCDEPTGDLDRKSADEIMNLLTTLVAKYHKTILMVTHDPGRRGSRRRHSASQQRRSRRRARCKPFREPRMKFSRLILANLVRKKGPSGAHARFFCCRACFCSPFSAWCVTLSTAARTLQVRIASSPSIAPPSSIPFRFPIATRSCAFPASSASPTTTGSAASIKDEKNFFPQFVIDPENQRQGLS